MEIKFVNRKYKTFFFDFNGTEVALKKIPMNNGDFIDVNTESAGLLTELTDKVLCAIREKNDISFFFRIGGLNALNILNAVAHDEFMEFFTFKCKESFEQGNKLTFEHFMQKLSGVNSRFNRYDGASILFELKDIYNKLKTISKDTLTIMRCENKEVDIAIEYCGSSENNLHFVCRINNNIIEIPKKNKAFTSPEDLLKDCIKVKMDLINDEDIVPFIEKYGGICAYSIIKAIAQNELLNYFRNIAERKIEQRIEICPRKIIKEYKLDNAIRRDPDDRLISMLEKIGNSTVGIYPKGNASELEKSDCWMLTYAEQGRLRFINFNFLKFEDETLRNEILRFLRLYFKYNSCQQLYRVFEDLSVAFHIMGSKKSILNITAAEATKLRIGLNMRKNLSVTTISEIINYMSKLYTYTAFCNNSIGQNPFEAIKLNEKNQYLNPTEPVSKAALNAIIQSYSKMPTYIQLAFLILCETGIRANEVCNLTVNDVGSTENATLKVVLRKNMEARSKSGRSGIVVHRISGELSEMLHRYIDNTETLREKINSRAVFVYFPARYRPGSQRKPVELKTYTLYYYMNKMLQNSGLSAKCTPRSIRAEVGRRLFSEGKSPTDVSLALGNTPAIAVKHYDKQSPEEEAEMYSRFYDNTMSFFNNKTVNAEEKNKIVGIELYGTCTAPKDKKCDNSNHCANCPQRIQCK